MRVTNFIKYAKNLLIKFMGDTKITHEPNLLSELDKNAHILKTKHQSYEIFIFHSFPSQDNPKNIKKEMFYNNYFKLISGTICNWNLNEILN